MARNLKFSNLHDGLVNEVGNLANNFPSSICSRTLNDKGPIKHISAHFCTLITIRTEVFFLSMCLQSLGAMWVGQRKYKSQRHVEGAFRLCDSC